jgi:hypothetical protein
MHSNYIFICTTSFDIKNLYIVHTQWDYVLHMIHNKQQLVL